MGLAIPDAGPLNPVYQKKLRIYRKKMQQNNKKKWREESIKKRKDKKLAKKRTKKKEKAKQNMMDVDETKAEEKKLDTNMMDVGETKAEEKKLETNMMDVDETEAGGKKFKTNVVKVWPTVAEKRKPKSASRISNKRNAQDVLSSTDHWKLRGQASCPEIATKDIIERRATNLKVTEELNYYILRVQSISANKKLRREDVAYAWLWEQKQLQNRGELPPHYLKALSRLKLRGFNWLQAIQRIGEPSSVAFSRFNSFSKTLKKSIKKTKTKARKQRGKIKKATLKRTAKRKETLKKKTKNKKRNIRKQNAEKDKNKRRQNLRQNKAKNTQIINNSNIPMMI